jgi:hypothetical protein
MSAVAGPPVRVLGEAEQRDHLVGRFQEQVTARASVTAVRSALRHIRLAPKRDGAGAAIASLDMNLCFVDKAGH